MQTSRLKHPARKKLRWKTMNMLELAPLIRKKEHTILSLKTWVAPEIMCYLPLGNSTLHLRVRRLVVCHVARSDIKM
jgi:hypothetical protein